MINYKKRCKVTQKRRNFYKKIIYFSKKLYLCSRKSEKNNFSNPTTMQKLSHTPPPRSSSPQDAAASSTLHTPHFSLSLQTGRSERFGAFSQPTFEAAFRPSDNTLLYIRQILDVWKKSSLRQEFLMFYVKKLQKRTNIFYQQFNFLNL